ncbi:hypothetical protein ACTFIW_003627 [Dictyostelium discoideum]
MKLLSVLITLLIFSVIYSHANPVTLTYSVELYDQFPGYNNNFQTNVTGGRVTGLVKSTLNSTTRVPELVSKETGGLNNAGHILNPSLFPYFFTPQLNSSLPGENSPYSFELVFTYDKNRNTYVYNNEEFFPIDVRGFDFDQEKRIFYNGTIYHNYHFCMKINSAFTYQGSEYFNFQTDHEAWAFINNKLVIDLGGIHGPIAARINTKNLGLTIGRPYNLDLFFCNRQTVGSKLKIEINLTYLCPFRDFCGVCLGDGSSFFDQFQGNNNNFQTYGAGGVTGLIKSTVEFTSSYFQCYETQIPGDICDCGCGCGIKENKCKVSWCTPEGICQNS